MKEKTRFRPRLSKDEYAIVQEYRAIKDTTDEMNIDSNDVKHGWLKSKEASIFFTNPEYQKPEFNVEKIDWESITAGVLRPELYKARQDCINPIKCKFDRLVYTDVHIGMKIPAEAQYGGKWDKFEVMDNLSQMIGFVLSQQKSDILMVDDLGDFMDGMGGKTVRKMHDLPQNMTDQEAFDVGLEFKLRLARELFSQYKTIYFHNICNDNHAGAFGYTVNSAFKAVAMQMFGDNITVDNYLKFINHYEIDNNTFILCHGKDGKNLKFGFKPQISDKGADKINNYIDKNYLMKRGARIEFSKGDSHVELKDKAKPTRFEYWNYPAFCPASDWVQTNYVPNDHGFYFFNYSDTNRYQINPYYFNKI